MTLLTQEQRELLAHHWRLVKAAQAQFNLTAIIDDEAARDKHYCDCLALLPLLDQSQRPQSLLDLGSGAGFPGLVLAVARPDISVTLLEATAKKCDFLRMAAAELSLDNVRVVNERAEILGRDPACRGCFELITARAVAGLNVLAELALPLLKRGGRLLAMKGSGWREEAEAAASALALLGGKLLSSCEYSLAGGDQRAILIVEKTATTPDKYPRRPGIPHKRPL